MEFRRAGVVHGKPHEQTIPTNLDLVHQQVVDAGAYTKPILVDRVTGTILMANRHAVGRRLGLTRLPALLIDYQSDPTIQLDVWPACGRTELTKQEVIDMALSPSVFPPKTSRHSFDGLDRENDLPEIDIPLRALSGKAYHGASSRHRRQHGTRRARQALLLPPASCLSRLLFGLEPLHKRRGSARIHYASGCFGGAR